MSKASAAKAPDGRALDTKDLSIFEGVDGSVRLRVGVDVASSRLMICNAIHLGAADPLTKRTLDRLCEIIVGRPLQEAADHGVIYVIAANPEDCAPVAGIRTARSAGPAFSTAERLLRQVHHAVQSHLNVGHREHAWYVRPGQQWLALDERAQADSIRPIIIGFLQSNGLDDDVVFISRIERGTRVTLGFGEHVSYKIKSKLLLELEKVLRRETGNPLELFMAEMKDANQIRRLQEN
jgi:hypothetical protein